MKRIQYISQIRQMFIQTAACCRVLQCCLGSWHRSHQNITQFHPLKSRVTRRRCEEASWGLAKLRETSFRSLDRGLVATDAESGAFVSIYIYYLVQITSHVSAWSEDWWKPPTVSRHTSSVMGSVPCQAARWTPQWHPGTRRGNIDRYRVDIE